MNPQINAHIHRQLIYDRGAKSIPWGRIVFSINDADKTGQPHANERNCIPILHHTQQSKWIKTNPQPASFSMVKN